jgi:hypothetical protein
MLDCADTSNPRRLKGKQLRVEVRLRELYSVGICYIIVMKVNRVTGDTKLSIVLDVNKGTM